MSVTVTLAEGEPALARVPIGAVFDAGARPERLAGRSAVRRGRGDAGRRRTSEDADYAYIASGAPEGAEIVALGVHKIDATQKVRIVQTLAGL